MGNWKAPPGWQRLRKQTFERHGHVCRRCGGYADTVDHVVAVRLGGSHDPSNLRPACRRCNFATGATLGNKLRGRLVVIQAEPRPETAATWTPSRDW